MKDLSFELRGPTKDDPRPVVIDFSLATEKDFKPYDCAECGKPVTEKRVVLDLHGNPFCSLRCRDRWQVRGA